MVVEEVVAPIGEEKVSSKELEKVEVKPQIDSEAAKTEEIKTTVTPALETVEVPAKKEIKLSPVFWILIPGIFLLGAILGGIVFYQKGVNRGASEVPTTSTPSPSTTPSASPSAQVDLTKYTIAVLNGSGIAGEAGRVKELLTSAGFKVGSTGNATTYDYKKTVIKAKSTVDTAFTTILIQTLSKTYLVDSLQTLSDSSTDTIQVIVGSSKAP